jgi:hypothetical protein
LVIVFPDTKQQGPLARTPAGLARPCLLAFCHLGHASSNCGSAVIFSIGSRVALPTMPLVDSRLGGFMIRREHITAPELLFLSVAAAGVIGVITAGLELIFRFAG